MTPQEQKQLLYKKLNALRLEVHESIVDDIKKTVDELFAPPAPAQGVEEADEIIRDIYNRHAAINGDKEPDPYGDLLKGTGKADKVVLSFVRELFNAGSRWQQGQQPAPTCCARWVKASERLPDKELGRVFAKHLGVKNNLHYIFNAWTISSNAKTIEESDLINIEWLDESACTCQQELEELRAWKKQATEVMPDFQAIAKELDIPLGHTVHDKILTGIKKLKEKATVSVIGARWVNGEYERLYDLGKSGKRIPCFVDYDWLRDGTRILRDIAVLTPQTMNIGARGIGYISPFADENTTEKEDFIIKCEQSNVEWLDESPCTFPTREQAEQWAKVNLMWLDSESIVQAMSMYDWILSKLNQRQ